MGVDQTWDGFLSTDWNTRNNWNPGDSVPTHTASFANTIYNKIVDLGKGNVGIDLITFNAGADKYTFNIAGAHFTVNQSVTGTALGQTFNISTKGTMDFSGQAGTSDDATYNINSQGTLTYHTSSTAFTSILNVQAGGTLNFGSNAGNNDFAFAGSSTINSSGTVNLFNTSSTEGATIQVQAGSLNFMNKSTAGSNKCTIQISSGAQVSFADTSDGGSAALTVNSLGKLIFDGGAKTSNSTIDVKSGGTLFMNGDSQGGTGAVTIEANGLLDASNHSKGTIYFGTFTLGGSLFIDRGINVMAGAPPAAGGTGHQIAAGALSAASVAPAASGTIKGNGEFGVNFGNLVFSGDDQSTASLVTSNGTLELTSSAKVAGGLAYEGLAHVAPIIQFDAANVAALQIKDMARTDSVDVRYHAFSANEQAVWTQNAQNSAGTLTFGTGTSAVSLNIAGVHTSNEFKLSSDGAGGTLVVDQGTSQTISQGLSAIAGNGSYGRVDLVDGSANLLANLDALQAIAPRIASISLTDASALNLTAAKSVADHAALSMIASPGSFTVVATTPGNNLLEGGGGNDTLKGAVSGLNTAIFTGAASEYRISQSGSSTVVSDTFAYRDGNDTLTNIQRLHFSNEIVALDLDGNAGQAYRLYQAAFARTPDENGVSYWVNQVDKGMSLHDAAQSFINSAEFGSHYGASPSTQTLVTGFYTNVLGRAPDASGQAYWVGLVQGGMSIADLLVNFSESAENKAHVAPGIQNGIDLSLSFFG